MNLAGLLVENPLHIWGQGCVLQLKVTDLGHPLEVKLLHPVACLLPGDTRSYRENEDNARSFILPLLVGVWHFKFCLFKIVDIISITYNKGHC